MNTVYIRPEAFPLFECENPLFKKLYTFIGVISTIEGGGNHTVMIVDYRRPDNITKVAETPEGMMCKFKCQMKIIYLSAICICL